ncbi:MAG TPA: hypothetical protein VGS00_07760 [Thermoanaerobaculia bacterium]|nr:hypothetical protein [Thermoanaerobaculia bacterium]
MSTPEERLHRLEAEIERKLLERFASLRDEFDRLRVESDQRWAGFLSRFEQDFRGMVPPELMEAPASAAAAVPGALSIDAARTLDEAADQVEVLHKYLELARRHSSRAVLLIARGESLGVWKAIGFSDHGGSDEGVRRVALTVSQGGPLARVMGGEPMALSAGNEISAQLGSGDATRAVLIPMVVKEKVSGALYADCVSAEEAAFDAGSLGFLTYLASLVVDRLATRKRKPAPALLSAAAASAAPPKEEAPLDFALPKPEPELAGEPELELVDSTLPPKAPPARKPPPAPAQPARPAPPAVQSPGPPAEDTAAPGARPSAEARRLAGPLAPGDGDERREEARRFAKLLISEIKLYNERAVLEGREHGNIYERLKEDIDRSRKMYDDRVPEDVRSSSNFFHEELVRILADGRAESLGI